MLHPMLHPSRTPVLPRLPKLAAALQRLKSKASRFEIDRGLQPAILPAVSARKINWLNERSYDVRCAPNIIEPKKSRAAIDLLPTSGLKVIRKGQKR